MIANAVVAHDSGGAHADPVHDTVEIGYRRDAFERKPLLRRGLDLPLKNSRAVRFDPNDASTDVETARRGSWKRRKQMENSEFAQRALVALRSEARLGPTFNLDGLQLARRNS